jgi:SAM-dependent methyltransferase
MSVSNTELEVTYHRRFDSDLDYRHAVWKILVTRFFSRYVRPSDQVLDLGCGYGQFINQIECARRYAMDLNPASRRALLGEIAFFQQDCSDKWPLEPMSLDVVFTSNFFEHLPSKAHLKKALAEAYRCLRPRGLLIAMGPNAKYIPGPYWDFFDHHIPLTELSLQEALELAGFRPVEVIARFLPYTMVNAPRYSVGSIALYLKMRWLWRLFGKQFLVIVEKS